MVGPASLAWRVTLVLGGGEETLELSVLTECRARTEGREMSASKVCLGTRGRMVTLASPAYPAR